MTDANLVDFQTIYDHSTSGRAEFKQVVKAKPKPKPAKAAPVRRASSNRGRWVLSDDVFTCDYVDRGRRDQYLGLTSGVAFLSHGLHGGDGKKNFLITHDPQPI